METLSLERTLSASALLSAMNDPVRDVLLTAIESAPGIVEAHGRGAAGLKVLGKLLDDAPKYMLATKYADIDALDVQSIAHSFIDTLPEFAALRGYPIRFVWQRNARKSGNGTVFGTCRVTSSRERLLWQGLDPAPWWEITMALDWWLLADDWQRKHALSHEMMHADVDVDEESGKASPTSRGHDVEEFYASAGRFGPKDSTALRLALHTVNHPSVAERAIAWGEDTNQQGLLFGPYTAEAE